MWIQQTIRLPSKPRGFHLITREITDQISKIRQCRVGLLHLFLQHTSASLTINENSDPDVRDDLERACNHIVPESIPFAHSDEGPDDMPAHVKSSLLGPGLVIPIAKGQLALGTWQGIYLNEHRDRGGSRCIIATVLADG